MKKFYLFIAFLLCLNLAFGQWMKLDSIPSSHIIALGVNNSTLYAASDSNIIYKSNDGLHWNAMSISNIPVEITSMGFYNNEIYIGTADVSVFNSADDGATWHNTALSTIPASRFVVKNSALFAATFGDGVYKLDTNTSRWLPFTNALPTYSYNVQNIISAPNFLIIGAGSNGTFYRYNFTSNEWKEEYYFGRLRPGLQINRLINNRDTLWAVNSNRIVRSNNAGVSWVEDNLGAHNGIDRNIYAGANNYYTLTNLFPTGTWIQQRNKTASVNTDWAVNEELLPEGYAWDIIEFNEKLFLAKHDGLYVKTPNIIVPVQFTLFNAKCDDNKVVIQWKTAQEQNSNRFDIEKSNDGDHWSVIGSVPAAGNSTIEKSYSFIDNNPIKNIKYRIAMHEINGAVQYSGTRLSSCSLEDKFNFGPNPVHDFANINVLASSESHLLIKLFDSKGALVKIRHATILQGSNQIVIDMKSLAKGTYLLSAVWNIGQMQKTVQVIKQ